MSDENERSVASTGSVGPVAWAVMDGTKTLVGYHSCSREKAQAWAREYGFPEVVPLYTQQQPILADAEREAIREAVRGYKFWAEDHVVYDQPEVQAVLYRLNGLLERLK